MQTLTKTRIAAMAAGLALVGALAVFIYSRDPTPLIAYGTFTSIDLVLFGFVLKNAIDSAALKQRMIDHDEWEKQIYAELGRKAR